MKKVSFQFIGKVLGKPTRNGAASHTPLFAAQSVQALGIKAFALDVQGSASFRASIQLRILSSANFYERGTEDHRKKFDSELRSNFVTRQALC